MTPVERSRQRSARALCGFQVRNRSLELSGSKYLLAEDPELRLLSFVKKCAMETTSLSK